MKNKERKALRGLGHHHVGTYALSGNITAQRTAAYGAAALKRIETEM